jgi:dinuclear metal center YbgI/SA1388 family protein
MHAAVKDILAAMEVVAPFHLAEDWDNVGLQLGSRLWPVKRVMTALDPTPEVVREVMDRQGDVLVTHHPLIFTPLRALDIDRPMGRTLDALLMNRIAVIAAHTNLDAVRGGVNDVLASRLGMDDVAILQPSERDASCGLGRIGRIAPCSTLGELAVTVKDRMGLPHIRFAGSPGLQVRRVALCSGSGSSMIDAFLASEAEVFITGDVRYHEAREIEAHGRGIVDAGHFESEHIILDVLTNKINEQMISHELDVIVESCVGERAPFQTI